MTEKKIESSTTRDPNPLQIILFFVIFLPVSWFAVRGFLQTNNFAYLWANTVALILALLIASAFRIADQWEKAVVLRLGNFTGLRGPGPFFIIPLVDRVAYWIDLRVSTTDFKAEKTITKDTVPVDVDAVLFWKVLNPEKAALMVYDYRSAISWASQTALREVIGKAFLSEILEGRGKLDVELQKVISDRTSQWGVEVSSVEIRDVVIPAGLQNAMSMQAQAEREQHARVILGESEKLIAGKFTEAANTYANNPGGMHLRAMNMLYEGLKTGNAMIVVVPAPVLNTMSLGDTTGIIALAKTVTDKTAGPKVETPETPTTPEK